MSPDANEEIHGDQHDLPEDIEEEEVQGEEDPDHSGLQQEEKDIVLLHPVGNRVPRAEDREGAQKSAEADQPKADPVHPHVVTHPHGLDPGGLLDQLHLPAAKIK